MHNFPKDVQIVCKEKHTLEQSKEILKLCVDNDVPIYSSYIFNDKVREEYPYYLWDGTSLMRVRMYVNSNIAVSLEEFKQFIIGKGKYKVPFNKELKLNSEYTAIVTKEKIIVGCQQFSHDIVKKLYLLSQKAQKS